MAGRYRYLTLKWTTPTFSEEEIDELIESETAHKIGIVEVGRVELRCPQRFSVQNGVQTLQAKQKYLAAFSTGTYLQYRSRLKREMEMGFLELLCKFLDINVLHKFKLDQIPFWT